MTSDITLTESTVTTITGSTVSGLQGNPVSATTPSTDQVLEWNGSEWAPANLPSALPPNGSAGGDLGGTYPNPTVININGTSVPSSPSANQVLIATSGTAATWEQITNSQVSSSAAIAVSKLASGTSAQLLLNNSTPTPTWTTISGDVSLTNTGGTTVVALQGNAIESGTLGSTDDGYILTWKNANSQWQPLPPPTSGVQYEYFTSSGSWTCPSGVTSVIIVAAGGGGGGAGGYGGNPAGGGGGGGSAQQTGCVLVTPSDSYTITIGAGGTGGTGGANGDNPGAVGNNGSTTTFALSATVLFACVGASGGGTEYDSTNPGNNLAGTTFDTASMGGTGGSGGGSGTAGSNGYIGTYSGGSGGAGAGSPDGGGGGGGGAGPQGNGGNGAPGEDNNGYSASANTGAGGGGGGGNTGGIGGNGGNGGSGYLYIIY
jgi:hypothetical protein